MNKDTKEFIKRLAEDVRENRLSKIAFVYALEAIAEYEEEYDEEEDAPVQKKVELEDNNFRVNSDGWRKVTTEGREYLENKTKDIWEFNDGEYKGEQLFTWKSAMREAEKIGRRLPTIDELYEAKIENPKYVGYRHPSSSFYYLGSNTLLWSSSRSGSDAWVRTLHSENSSIYRTTHSQDRGFSVRLIKLI